MRSPFNDFEKSDNPEIEEVKNWKYENLELEDLYNYESDDLERESQ